MGILLCWQTLNVLTNESNILLPRPPFKKVDFLAPKKHEYRHHTTQTGDLLNNKDMFLSTSLCGEGAKVVLIESICATVIVESKTIS